MNINEDELANQEHDIFLEAIERILSAEDSEAIYNIIRIESGTLATHGIKPTRAQVDRGLTKAYKNTRKMTISNNDVVYDWIPMVEWVRRQDYPPTEQQVIDGLRHQESSVRNAWAKRTDYSPTDLQITTGLLDLREYVRASWLDREDITFNADHIEKMLRFFETYDVMTFDTLPVRSIAAMQRQDIQLAEADIERVTNSKYYKDTDQDEDPRVHDFIRAQIAQLASHDADQIMSRKRHAL